MMQFELEVLYRWRLYCDRQLMHPRTREQRVLAFLAVRGPIPRRRLAGLLWPESTECRASDSLRVSLYHIHHQLPGVLGDADGWLELADSVQVDLHRLRGQLEQVLNEQSGGSANFDFLFGAADLLPDWDEPWLHADQEELRRQRIQALEVSAQRALENGLILRAGDLAHAALNLDPFNEPAALVLARAEFRHGNRASAKAGLLSFIDHLREEVGVEPSAELIRILSQLRGA